MVKGIMRRLALVVALALALAIPLTASADTYDNASASCSALNGAIGKFYVKNLTSSGKSFPKAGMTIRVTSGSTTLFYALRPTALTYVAAGATKLIYQSSQYHGFNTVLFSGEIPSSQWNTWHVQVNAYCI